MGTGVRKFELVKHPRLVAAMFRERVHSVKTTGSRIFCVRCRISLTKAAIVKIKLREVRFTLHQGLR